MEMSRMAREIKTLICLNAKQTGEFLASLGSKKNAKNRAKMFAMAKNMQLNVI